MPSLFNKKILKNDLDNYQIENINKKIKKIKHWQKNLSTIQGINEKTLQSAFLRAIFEDILGYENAPQKNKWTLKEEATTEIDSKRPDGIIGFFERINNKKTINHNEAVIELKGPKISLDKNQKRKGTTYKSPVDQVFGYTNKLDKCKWAIVSNFMEIRLYKVGRSKEYYEVFLLDELDKKEEFKKFYYLLNKENFLPKNKKSVTLKLSEKTIKKEENISIEFYNLYKKVRIELFEHLKDKNPGYDLELLIEKSQKFLDRIIFICFCEDKNLLDNDLLKQVIEKGKNSFSLSSTSIWNEIKGVFRSIDKGNPAHNINRYNGGLFKYDEKLDNLIIENIFFDNVYEISQYNFDSDLDVNILGHIFEQSISDIEKLKNDIKEGDFEKEESKRHKDGIFYTPQRITSYIVEKAIGGYLENIKKELNYYDLPDIEEAGSKGWKTQYTKKHVEFYNKYEKILKNLKILDSSVGSGAFINKSFDYLIEEHKWLNKQRDILKQRKEKRTLMSIFSLEHLHKNILENNLYGVDINEASVEITKLSLWLKTANKNKQLTNLDNNIKQGNSLIDKKELDQKNYFIWEEEFPEIMANGGFDVIIGNPPYHVINKEEQDALYKNYEFNNDLYHMFFELSLKKLSNKKHFTFGFITPRFFLFNQNCTNLRKTLLEKYNLNTIVETTPFEDATTENVITIINNKENKEYIDIYKDLNKEFIKINEMDKKHLAKQKTNGYTINTALFKEDIEILKKLEKNSNNLSEITESKRGMEVSKKKVRKINNGTPTLIGEDLNSFIIDFQSTYIDKKDKEYKRLEDFFFKDLIYLRRVSDSLIAATSNKDFAFTKNLYGIKVNNKYDKKYILSLLNSNLLTYYYRKKFSTKKEDVFPEIQKYLYEQLPIPKNSKYKDKIIQTAELINEIKKKNLNIKEVSFMDFVNKYANKDNKTRIESIVKHSNFYDDSYQNRASKLRNYTININTNVVTIYLDKSGNGKYQVLKFEEDNRYKRDYLKLYLENLTDKQINDYNNNFDGNILDKTLKVKIPDYNNEVVVKKIIKEWNKNVKVKNKNIETIKTLYKSINSLIYKEYNLNDNEIQIIEDNQN